MFQDLGSGEAVFKRKGDQGERNGSCASMAMNEGGVRELLERLAEAVDLRVVEGGEIGRKMEILETRIPGRLTFSLRRKRLLLLTVSTEIDDGPEAETGEIGQILAGGLRSHAEAFADPAGGNHGSKVSMDQKTTASNPACSKRSARPALYGVGRAFYLRDVMIRLSRFAGIAAIVFALGMLTAQGGLVFDQPILELRSTPSVHSVEGTFVFRNTGDRAVTIRKVKTGCGCTSTKLDRDRIEPGERGEIEVKFNYGFEKGRLRKLLSVYTDDEDQPEIPLELRVNVEVPVQLSPTLVYWRKGEDPATKSVEVEIAHELPVTITRVRTEGSGFAVALRRLGGDGKLAIDVTPESTRDRAGASIYLETESASGRQETYKAYARVR